MSRLDTNPSIDRLVESGKAGNKGDQDEDNFFTPQEREALAKLALLHRNKHLKRRAGAPMNYFDITSADLLGLLDFLFA